MPSVLVVDKKNSLADVIAEIRRQTPKRKIHRSHTYPKAMEHMQYQMPSSVLVDEDVDRSFEFCHDAKERFESERTGKFQVSYFVRNRQRYDNVVPFIDNWYVKGSYIPKEFVRNLKP